METPFGVHQASKMVLDKEKIDRYIFSGTDNGIVKMTETIPLDLEKFQYHIKLYNKYSPLVDHSDQDEGSQLDFIPLPKPFTISPVDIDVGCSHMRSRRQLEKDKKVTIDGRVAFEIEKELQKSSLRKATTAEDAERAHILQLEH